MELTMNIKALDKVNFHLENIRKNGKSISNQLDIDCIEKILNFTNGDLTKIIDTEIVFKK